MKAIKILLFVVGGLIVLALIAAGGSYYLYHGTPSWYRPRHLTEAQQRAAADSADQKFAEAVSWAASVRAHERQLHHQTTKPSDVLPDTISLSQDEITAAFDKWGSGDALNLKSKFSKYFTDPRIVLADGRIILAGTSKDLGTVVSAHFEPALGADGLRIRLAEVSAGRLPLPQSALADEEQKLKDRLRAELPDWKQDASMDPEGTSNAATVKAYLAQVLLHMLSDEPGPAVIFLPCDVLEHPREAVPVKLTALKIDEKKLEMTIEPMTEAERAELFDQIRQQAPAETTAANQ